MSDTETTNKQLTKEEPTDIIRQHLVNTAIKFLQNDRVRLASEDQRKTFLRQKGLTENEIEAACKETISLQLHQPTKPFPPLLPPPILPFQDSLNRCNNVSIWFKIRDIANVVALLSIGSYTLYTLWYRYISPKLFGTRSRKEDTSQKLFQVIANLNENVLELKGLIQKLSTQQAQQQRLLLSEEPSTKLTNKGNGELEELKQELASIKALLLNRTQFPTSPGIPSWQMVDKETGGEEDDDRDSSPGLDVDIKSVGTGGKESESGDVLPQSIGLSTNRKHSSSGSRDSIGLQSDSSCEVVVVGTKNDSSDLDHSDD